MDVDLTAPGFEIYRRSSGQLYLEVYIADITEGAIVADDVNNQTSFRDARIDRGLAVVHERRDRDFVAVPGLDGDRPCNILQFEANVLAGRKAARHFLLGQSKARCGEDNQN